MNRQRFWCMTVVALLWAASAVAGDLPWVGKWKSNPAKGDYGQETYTYAATADGGLQWKGGGLTGNVRLDGKEYPEPDAGTEAWKQVDASTWEVVHRQDGRVTYTETLQVSQDGNALKAVAKGTRRNGTAFENEYVYQRASGGPGLLGTWKTTKVNRSSPVTWEFTALDGESGLSLRILETGTTWSGRFDGKDSPTTSATMTGRTMAIEKTGPRVFTYVVKQDGKERSRGTVTVSEDGRALLVKDTNTATKEATTEVYDRQ